MKKIFAIALLSIILFSCNSISKLGIGTKQAPIMNSSWILDDASSSKQITFELKNNKISGNAGCNNYFSNDVVIDSENGAIKINSIGSTRMACPDLAMENNYLQLLDKVTNYVIKENKMELYAGKILLLRFSKK